MEKIRDWVENNKLSGYGSGYGYGDGSGDGSGYGSGYGIKKTNSDEVFLVDNIETIIKSIKGNTAKGFIVETDLTLTSCFLVKANGLFAHGKTLKEAVKSLEEKLFQELDEDERLDEFVKHFPSFEKPYLNKEFFDWHNKLTGSCLMGREQFAKGRGINLKESMTVKDFISLTKSAYGGEIIEKLIPYYN